MNPTVLRSLRLALASLIATALAAQLIIGLVDNNLTVVRFFSFFTVLSNTLSVVMLTMLAMNPTRDSNSWFAMFRGAVTVYMSVTAMVWAVVLAPNYVDVAVPEPWIDLSIHVIAPVLIIIDWFVNRVPVELPTSSIGVWLVLPATYFAYSLIRGAIVGWYPYPFLDPAETDGYGGVAIGAAVVVVVIVGFSTLYYWWANHVREGNS